MRRGFRRMARLRLRLISPKSTPQPDLGSCNSTTATRFAWWVIGVKSRRDGVIVAAWLFWEGLNVLVALRTRSHPPRLSTRKGGAVRFSRTKAQAKSQSRTSTRSKDGQLCRHERQHSAGRAIRENRAVPRHPRLHSTAPRARIRSQSSSSTSFDSYFFLSSAWVSAGTGAYFSNSIVNSALPWVIDRRSVA